MIQKTPALQLLKYFHFSFLLEFNHIFQILLDRFLLTSEESGWHEKKIGVFFASKRAFRKG